jgi:hypothetical protein
MSEFFDRPGSSPHSVQQLLAQLQQPCRTIVILILLTGMRIGEALALRWGKIQWRNQSILVDEGLYDGEVSSPKTASGVRSLPMSELLAAGPHEALDMMCPAEVYQPSTRAYTGLPDSTILSTTRPSSSPIAAASVSAAKKSTSVRSSPARLSVLQKFTTKSGSSVLWIMIWDTSIWRLAGWNRWNIPSAQKCYLCSRYVL